MCFSLFYISWIEHDKFVYTKQNKELRNGNKIDDMFAGKIQTILHEKEKIAMLFVFAYSVNITAKWNKFV